MEKPSSLSYRAMETFRFPDAIRYEIGCDCGDSHFTFELERDEEFPCIMLNIYGDLHYSSRYAYPDNWWNRFWKRIGGALRLLFTGIIEVGGEMVIIEGRHLDSIIQALQEGREYLKE